MMDGGALLVQAALGAALFYLQRNLIDVEILSQGRFEGYVPPDISDDDAAVTSGGGTVTSGVRSDAVKEQHQQHLTLDGTTLLNLEILSNTNTNTNSNSNTLFHTTNHCKSPRHPPPPRLAPVTALPQTRHPATMRCGHRAAQRQCGPGLVREPAAAGQAARYGTIVGQDTLCCWWWW